MGMVPVGRSIQFFEITDEKSAPPDDRGADFLCARPDRRRIKLLHHDILKAHGFRALLLIVSAVFSGRNNRA